MKKELQITWKGTKPLLMNSCQTVNPLHHIAIAKKQITDKKTGKTEEDFTTLSNLEWEGSLYWDKDIGAYIPSANIKATLINGAKKYRDGENFKRYVDIKEDRIPLDYGRKMTKEELMDDYAFRDVRSVVVKNGRVMRTRARFDTWAITFTLIYDDEGVNLNQVARALEAAGSQVGLCDNRPEYGLFAVVIKEIPDTLENVA